MADGISKYTVLTEGTCIWITIFLKLIPKIPFTNMSDIHINFGSID